VGSGKIGCFENIFICFKPSAEFFVIHVFFAIRFWEFSQLF